MLPIRHAEGKYLCCAHHRHYKAVRGHWLSLEGYVNDLYEIILNRREEF